VLERARDDRGRLADDVGHQYIVKNANLEELGAANAHLVCLVVPPLRIRGASASPLRMLALSPRRA
jgi:kynurenine formamidase